MLGYANVRVLPIKRRDSFSLPVVRGLTAAVYNVMPDGTPAVNSQGTIQPGATLAYICADRYGRRIMPNPFAVDEYGGPNDDYQIGEEMLVSFFAFPGEYSLLVTVTGTGTKFGLPRIIVTRIGRPTVSSTMEGMAAATNIFANNTLTTNPYVTETSGANNSILGDPGSLGARLNITVGTGANSRVWMMTGYNSGNSHADPFKDDGTVTTSTRAWGQSHVIDAIITPGAITAPIAETKSGIFLGGAGASGALISSTLTIALIAIYFRADTLAWEMYCRKGNNSAGTTTALTGAPTVVAYNSYRVRLVLVGAQYASAWISGVEYGRMTDTTFLPIASNANDIGPGVVCTTGNDGSATTSTAFNKLDYEGWGQAF